jgi:hypothetical protein
MKFTTIKIYRKICAFALALAVLIGVTLTFAHAAFAPLLAQAAETAPNPGIYTLTAAPYYAHPMTGVIEDSGQNPGIGQGMTESVLARSALLEVYGNGEQYVTVRFSLMDNIKDITVSVQKDADSAFEDVPYTITKEDMDAGTADIRFAVPDENAIARAAMFVEPMGRDVIFFMTFADPVPGAGDFVYDPEAEEDGAAAALAQEESAADTDGTVDSDTSANAGALPEPDAPQAAAAGNNEKNIFILAAVLIVLVVVIIGVIAYRKKAKR